MAPALCVCHLFGRRVVTEIPPPHTVSVESDQSLDITLHPGRLSAPPRAPSLSVPMVHPGAHGDYHLWSDDRSLFLRVAPIADFLCTADRIVCSPLIPQSLDALQWQLYGLILSAWSEWAGRPVLHAATVEVSGGAVGFLGDSGAGKSSLALAFLEAGHRVMGDDQLILDVEEHLCRVLPAVPWFKVGRSVASQWSAGRRTLPLIHAAAEKHRLDLHERQWATTPLPLRRLYVVDRSPSAFDVSFARLSPSAALMALVRFSYVPRTVAATRVDSRRLPQLSAAVRQAEVFKLTYPDSFTRLADVRQAVADHAQAG